MPGRLAAGQAQLPEDPDSGWWVAETGLRNDGAPGNVTCRHVIQTITLSR